MSFKSRMLISAALLGTMVSPALSADYEPPVVYEPPMVIEQMEEYVPVEVGSGWYLRGDIGYSFSTSANGPFTYRTFDPIAGTYTPGTFTTGSYSGDLSYGVGFGYRFTDLIRADLTAENFNLRFNGTRDFAAPCPGQPFGTCSVADSAEMNAWSLMTNLYVDLGTFAKITPYVGAGIGLTYANWGTATSNYGCAGACVPFSLTHAGIDSWRFSYAAMAGIAYDINKNLKVDLGYKFRRVNGGEMFGFDAISRAAGATGAEARDPGFSQHEVRLGLRYELW